MVFDFICNFCDLSCDFFSCIIIIYDSEMLNNLCVYVGYFVFVLFSR